MTDFDTEVENLKKSKNALDELMDELERYEEGCEPDTSISNGE